MVGRITRIVDEDYGLCIFRALPFQYYTVLAHVCVWFQPFIVSDSIVFLQQGVFTVIAFKITCSQTRFSSVVKMCGISKKNQTKC